MCNNMSYILMTDLYLYAICVYVLLSEHYIIYVNERPRKTCLLSVVFEGQYKFYVKDVMLFMNVYLL